MVQVGGAGPALGCIPPEPGRPPGLQFRSAPHKGQPQPYRYFSKPNCGILQPLLRRHGSHRRMDGRPLFQKMGNHSQYPFLERCHNVHRPCKRRVPTHTHPFHRYRRRGGLLRARQLLPPGPVPHLHPRKGNVHSPDLLLRWSNPGRMACRIHRRPPWLAVRLLHLRRRGSRLGHCHGTATERPSKK